MTRRSLFAGALMAPSVVRTLDAMTPEAPSNRRAQSALRLRQRAALIQGKRPISSSTANSDEAVIPNWIACFAKGLPQNQFGEVEPAAYRSLLAALRSGKDADFERIPKGAGRKLSNPEAAFAFHLEGGDSHRFGIPPAPSITSQEAATETSELYWKALCRDVAFADYDRSPLIRDAASNLCVKPSAIFRGQTRNALEGPYTSQFLLKPIPYGAGQLDQRDRAPL